MEKKILSLDEQIAEAQRRFAAEKKRIKEKRAKRVMMIGEAVAEHYDGLIDRFDNPGFDINAFVMSTEFQRHFYQMMKAAEQEPREQN